MPEPTAPAPGHGQPVGLGAPTLTEELIPIRKPRPPPAVSKAPGGSSPLKGAGRLDNGPAPVEDPQINPGKVALQQLLKERGSKKKKRTSCRSLLRLYTTILAGLMIVFGLFTLLFLVPMTIDPALATLTYQFQASPVLCMTTFAREVVGLRNISWCSCTEGCTSDVYNCTQVTVVYRNCSISRNESLPEGDLCDLGGEGGEELSEVEGGGSDLTALASHTNPAHWDELNASLYINVKGCGYPPTVNCSQFFDYYGVPGRRYWCYYSHLDPQLVVPHYDPSEAELELANSLGWTVGAQLAGLIIILLLHWPYAACIRHCRRTW
ncbi:Protein tipE [Portunus trituberculatus]|uniref:Protein tipE n=1 Tax=Portunus trituberculatus TaxID=210409 RepID=A0A5B7GCA2_PORTR|nr:Protein tipE [Portunus trituberculatus]